MCSNLDCQWLASMNAMEVKIEEKQLVWWMPDRFRRLPTVGSSRITYMYIPNLNRRRSPVPLRFIANLTYCKLKQEPLGQPCTQLSSCWLTNLNPGGLRHVRTRYYISHLYVSQRTPQKPKKLFLEASEPRVMMKQRSLHGIRIRVDEPVPHSEVW